jgi:hypothetical protein
MFIYKIENLESLLSINYDIKNGSFSKRGGSGEVSNNESKIESSRL